jgi:uncharacterized membrane protein YhaH (DUF805 family)
MERFLPYFSFQGRTNRRRYWEVGITIFMLSFLAALVFSVLSRIPVVGPLFDLVLIGVVVVGFVATLANGARRLHDRGKSAWWLLVFAGVPIVLSVLRGLVALSSPDADGPAGFLALIGLGFSIWALVELGVLKGVAGPNRFGENPLAAPQEPAMA